MIDPFVILAAILLLPVVALLRFVGCAAILDIDSIQYRSKTTPQVVLDSSTPTSMEELSVTFTARVIPQSAPPPTGQVTFYDDYKGQRNPLDKPVSLVVETATVSKALKSTSSLGLGTHYITAEYNPGRDINYNAGIPSNTKQLDVIPLSPPRRAPDFELSLTPPDRGLIPAGNPTSYTVTITPKFGFNAPVDLKVQSLLPTGVTATFGPNNTSTIQVPTAGGPNSTQMNVTTKNNTRTGLVQIAITGNGNGVTHNFTVRFTVT
jgi:hypothetical protein